MSKSVGGRGVTRLNSRDMTPAARFHLRRVEKRLRIRGRVRRGKARRQDRGLAFFFGRPSLRAERSNTFVRRGSTSGLLRRFAPRNDVSWYGQRSAASPRVQPSF